MHAFYLEANKWQDKTLFDNEFSHLSKVLRLKVNDTFSLFDGEGRKSIYTLTQIQKKSANFEIIEDIYYDKPTSNIILAAAWTKAARRGFLFEKAVELEASELWIWHSQYSQFPLPDEDSATVQSWQMQLIAGLKQCENPFLPKLRLIKNQEHLIEESKKLDHFHVLTTDEAPKITAYTSDYLNLQGTTLLTIGPEGGFAPEETALFHKHNAQFFTMGDRILRYETAAVLALGLHFWHKNTSN